MTYFQNDIGEYLGDGIAPEVVYEGMCCALCGCELGGGVSLFGILQLAGEAAVVTCSVLYVTGLCLFAEVDLLRCPRGVLNRW